MRVRSTGEQALIKVCRSQTTSAQRQRGCVKLPAAAAAAEIAAVAEKIAVAD
jgi:hypothetical protein